MVYNCGAMVAAVLEHSGVGTQRQTKDRVATIISLALLFCKVTERDITLLTWLRHQVINFPKGSPLVSQRGSPVR